VLKIIETTRRFDRGTGLIRRPFRCAPYFIRGVTRGATPPPPLKKRLSRNDLRQITLRQIIVIRYAIPHAIYTALVYILFTAIYTFSKTCVKRPIDSLIGLGMVVGYAFHPFLQYRRHDVRLFSQNGYYEKTMVLPGVDRAAAYNRNDKAYNYLCKGGN